MEIRQLVYFRKVAELSSITRASAQLGVAQPALSRQISKLEAELGTRLLIRHGRGATATEAGNLLLRHAREILGRLSTAEAELLALRTAPGGAISIGMTPAMAMALGPPLVRRFRGEFPDVLVKLQEGFGGYLHDWLIDGSIDAALVYEPLASRVLLSEDLLEESLFIVGRPDDRALARRSMPLRMLAKFPLILPRKGHSLRSLLDHVAADHSLDLEVVVEVDSIGSLQEMVRSGIGYAVLGSGPIDAPGRAGHFSASRITSPVVKRRLTLTTSPRRPLRPAVRTLIALIRPEVRQLVRSGAWAGSLVD